MYYTARSFVKSILKKFTHFCAEKWLAKICMLWINIANVVNHIQKILNILFFRDIFLFTKDREQWLSEVKSFQTMKMDIRVNEKPPRIMTTLSFPWRNLPLPAGFPCLPEWWRTSTYCHSSAILGENLWLYMIRQWWWSRQDDGGGPQHIATFELS